MTYTRGGEEKEAFVSSEVMVMKIAQTKEGQSVIATATAPLEAVCPHCGGVLVLRYRRTMGNEKLIYYWRHESNRNVQCRARQRPIG